MPRYVIASTQGWNLSFRRFLNDWEIERVASLLEKLGGTSLDANATDRVIWKHNKEGKFTVNCAYKHSCRNFFSTSPVKVAPYQSTANLFSCWSRRGGSKTQKKWWELIPSCIWWSVWRERNGRNGRCLKIDPIPFTKENGIA
ncbi:hypothetical protein H5410_005683 [Solanum commersonii]|uniref:Uncharacterized protein n=1 Tax=Solanum commersonii TaxID=4109 RepID=A0A9J6A7G5_SOLCO|nr:hypothetical protein H5410_005683 [Solanum commersonii]